LVKQPINEIARMAREAGRKAFTDINTVRSVCEDVRVDWISKQFPNALGLSDDDFDIVIEQARRAFEEGVDEYCKDMAASGFTTEYRAGAAAALKKLGVWMETHTTPQTLAREWEAETNSRSGDERTGFSDTIAAYFLGFAKLGPISLNHWDPLLDLADGFWENKAESRAEVSHE
jgi:hypothetical protein